MYFVVSAGGTAGHINPALAVADELRSRGHEILFIGTPDHIEARLAEEAGFPFFGLRVSGFDKARPWTLITCGWRIVKSAFTCFDLFKIRRPDAVIGFGAYVCVPPCLAADSRKVPVLIHEQNSVPGLANRVLCSIAKVTAVAFEPAVASLHAKNAPVVVGNPVRASFEGASREAGRAAHGIPEDALVLAVMGGSGGARRINSAVAAMKEQLLAIPNLHIIQSTGERDHAAVVEELALTPEEAARWEVCAYINDMDNVLAAADFCVSRAGASSLAEIMTIGLPSILVPYPHARGDHQTMNARPCVEAGAAHLVADSAVDGPEFSALLMEMLGDAAARATMQKACAQFSGSNARVALADLVEQAARG